MSKATQTIRTAPNEGAVLTKAVMRSADRLRLNHAAVATILGLSPATVSRMASGEYQLKRREKAFELAVLLVRLYRSLDAIVSGDDEVARAWLRNPNDALRDAPMNMIRSIHGLVNVIQYLDARRAVL